MSSSEVAALQADVKAYQEQLEIVASSLQGDPTNAELQTLRSELEEAISITEEAIRGLAPAPPVPQRQQTPPPPPSDQKWSREKHPAFQPGYKRPGAPPSPPEEQQQPQAPVSFKVNDTVLAKWVSGDKAFYPARITSITGSSAAPVYNVTFKSYGNSETGLRGHDIKAISNDKKRKADGSPANLPPANSPASAPTINANISSSSTIPNSSVISAAAAIDPDLASQARREPSKVSDGPTRPAKVPRKVKANKELEMGKSKWQDFANKGKIGKGLKKDSMFRTGESINARGSGQAMRKDPTRSRHIYDVANEE